MMIGVIIVAGGSGSRMHSDVPKQFLPLAGREVLMRTLERFLAALPEDGRRIVVVLPEDERARWEGIVARHGIAGTHTTCRGGVTRFDSVRRGLAEVGDCDYVMVHDGVRPLVPEDMILRVLGTAEEHGTAIPVTEPADSFRVLDGGYPVPVDRALLRAVQTPQAFRRDILERAYRAEYRAEFTDDATVVESAGVRLSFCDGDRRNIKLTTPEDMALAAAMFAER